MTRTTFTLDVSMADQARRLGVNISAAARDGVAAAVRAALVTGGPYGIPELPGEGRSILCGGRGLGDE